MVEAAESQGLVASNNQAYKDFVREHLQVIFEANKVAKQEYGYMFNT